VPSDEERWRRKQAHYQDPEVVASYDAVRFAGAHQKGSSARKWRAIRRTLGEDLDRIETVLDVPCGTGRFTELLLGAGKRVVSADRSLPMLRAARERSGGGHAEEVLCDAGRLPFRDGAFDLVMSIRFLFHVPPPRRAAILREFGRVSRGWVVVDVRHRYSFTTWTKRLRARLGSRPMPSRRASLSEIRADLDAAGLCLEKRVWLSPPFSEKMLLFCVRA
jgi:SAM-dependent methyltransferase